MCQDQEEEHLPPPEEAVLQPDLDSMPNSRLKGRLFHVREGGLGLLPSVISPENCGGELAPTQPYSTTHKMLPLSKLNLVN